MQRGRMIPNNVMTMQTSDSSIYVIGGSRTSSQGAHTVLSDTL